MPADRVRSRRTGAKLCQIGERTNGAAQRPCGAPPVTPTKGEGPRRDRAVRRLSSDAQTGKGPEDIVVEASRS